MRFRVSRGSTVSRFVYNEESNTKVDLSTELADALTKKKNMEKKVVDLGL